MAKEPVPPLQPRAEHVEANGLVHHVLAWAPASGGEASRAVFLVHGFSDAAATWDSVAPILAAQGHRVFAPDMRGFGDAPRAPQGSYYHFPDYVSDLAALIDALCPDETVALVGHSMGGTIATLFAGARPEKVARLANVEGVGPPDNPWEAGPIRMRTWLKDLGVQRAPSLLTRAEARLRLGANHPSVPGHVLDARLPYLVRELEGGTHVTWRHDPLHRTTSPMPFFARLFREFAMQVTCPVLFVSGGPSGFHPPDEADRLAAFAQLERRTIDDAGHMVHWTRPAELAELLVPFLAT